MAYYVEPDYWVSGYAEGDPVNIYTHHAGLSDLAIKCSYLNNFFALSQCQAALGVTPNKIQRFNFLSEEQAKSFFNNKTIIFEKIHSDNETYLNIAVKRLPNVNLLLTEQSQSFFNNKRIVREVIHSDSISLSNIAQNRVPSINLLTQGQSASVISNKTTINQVVQSNAQSSFFVRPAKVTPALLFSESYSDTKIFARLLWDIDDDAQEIWVDAILTGGEWQDANLSSKDWANSLQTNSDWTNASQPGGSWTDA